MTEPSGSEQSGVVEVSVHGDKYSAESGEPFTFKVDSVVLLIGAGLHYGHFQLVASLPFVYCYHYHLGWSVTAEH